MTKEKENNQENISDHCSYNESIYSTTARRAGVENDPTADHLKVMKVTAEKLFEPLREYVGGPIRVNSFYRSEALNNLISGSASRSQHMKGQAMDLDALGGRSNAEMFMIVKDQLDFDQLIWEGGNYDEPEWVHVSYVSNKKNRKQVLKMKRKGTRREYRPFDGARLVLSQTFYHTGN
tara:strand:- start:12500 stop:13033 length:534 start_codon:yes stop_codon:yes gene_type:complete